MKLRTMALLSWLAGSVLAVQACGGDDATSGTGGASTGSDGGSGPAGSQSSSSSSSSSGGGAAPLTCPAMPGYTTVPPGSCDLLNQDCPDGLSCEPTQMAGTWSTECVGNNGLKGVGKSCINNSECQPGLFCVFDVCAPPCCPSTNEPCGGGKCNVELSFGPHMLMVCSFLKQCTLLTENACADENSGCHIQDAKLGLALCIPNTTSVKMEGEACKYLNECGDMQHCANGTCRYYCYVSAGGVGEPGLGGCPPNQKCMPGNYGIDDIGVCAPQ